MNFMLSMGHNVTIQNENYTADWFGISQHCCPLGGNKIVKSEVRYSEVSMSTSNIVRKHNQQNRRMYNSHSEISFHYDEKYIRFQNFSPTSFYNAVAPASDAETVIRRLDSRMRVKLMCNSVIVHVSPSNYRLGV
jgi:hypothetical protein